jgi:hypothetical protein
MNTYFLTTFDEKTEQSRPPYTTYKNQIENNGFIKVNNVKIYTPELTVILTAKNLTVENIQLQIETKINCSEFLQTYIKGYNEGEQYFENEFKISTNTLYSENAQHYIKNLHLNYYHIQHKAPYEGWIFVKNFYPLILSHNEIESFGYYSGIISKVQELKIKHSQLFIDFDKCTDEKQAIEKVENNNSEPKQQPTKAEILKTELGKYGFFELEKIKALSSEKTIIIIEKIAENGIPYAVAMFDYLGFISYLEINYFRTQYELIRKVSKWFNSDSEGRAIKGNINSLIIHSTENKARYTAFKHKEKVSFDYEQLK